MIELQGWSVRDYLTFNDTTLTLSHDHGLYVVHGHNKDSRTTDNANAVGKSRLLSIIPTILFESDPLAITKSNRKDVLKAKTSSADILIKTHEGKEIVIQQTPTKYFIGEKEDGEFSDIKAIKLDVARDYIKKAFPLSRSTFYATCYIQSQRDCGFQRSDSRGRLKYITELFGLNIYDDLHKEFKKQLSSLAKIELEAEHAAKTLNDARRELEELNKKQDSTVNIADLERRSKKLTDKLKDLYTKQGALSQSQGVAEKHKLLVERLSITVKKLSKFNIDKTDIKNELEQVQTDIEKHNKYKQYSRILEEYTAKYTSITKKLSKLNTDTRALNEIETAYVQENKKLTKLDREKEDYEDALENYTRKHKSFIRATEELIKLESKCKNTLLYKTLKLNKVKPKLWEERANPFAMLAYTTATLWSKLHSHKNLKECPVCGNDAVDYSELKIKSEQAKQTVKDYEIFKVYNEALTSLGKEPEKPKYDKTTDTKIKACIKLIAQLNKDGREFELRVQLEESLSELNKPKKVNKPKRKLEDLKIIQELCTEFISDSRRIKDLAPALTKSVEGNLEETKTTIKKLNTKLSTCNETLKTFNVLKLNIEHQSKLIKESNRKIQEIEPKVKQRNLLKAMVTAYTPKYLKLQAAESILSMLEDSLNKYSNLVYLEPMRFEIRAQENGVSAVAIRNNGERSDICHLSGAESNCFRLLFAISLLPLLPEKMRTNFLILDEPDGACSPPTREHLIKEFLPKLQTIVPHVFWITPKSIELFENCTVLKVVKEDGVSRLEVS